MTVKVATAGAASSKNQSNPSIYDKYLPPAFGDSRRPPNPPVEGGPPSVRQNPQQRSEPRTSFEKIVWAKDVRSNRR